MPRFHRLTVASAVLAMSATAASAQLYPLTNGPDGTAPNTVDSARGFTGGNAVAPEREFLYHPERAGNAAAALGITAAPVGGSSPEDAPPATRHRRHPRRDQSFR